MVRLNAKEQLVHDQLKDKIAQEKILEVKILSLLQEAIDRAIPAKLGYGTITKYCTEELGLSEDMSYKRTQAARVVKGFPELLKQLENGQTHVSHLAMLAANITDKNAEQIVQNLPGMSKDKLKLFLSNLDADGNKAGDEFVMLKLKLSKDQLDLILRAREVVSTGKKSVSIEDILEQATALLLEKRDPVRKAERAEERWKAKKVSEEKIFADVEEKRDLVKKVGNNRAEGGLCAGAGTIRRRYIPATLRHQVIHRDQGQCCYRNERGQRCPETTRLEVDHIHPFALGGRHELSNLQTLCAAHNRLRGRLTFGPPSGGEEREGETSSQADRN